MSLRIITAGPGPFSRIPTTPCPPIPVWTTRPDLLSSAAILAAVSLSWPESSGWAWSSR